MSSPSRRYRREFKLGTIRRVHETDRSRAQVAKKLGGGPNTVSRWMRESRSGKAEAIPATGRQTSRAAPAGPSVLRSAVPTAALGSTPS